MAKAIPAEAAETTPEAAALPIVNGFLNLTTTNATDLGDARALFEAETLSRIAEAFHEAENASFDAVVEASWLMVVEHKTAVLHWLGKGAAAKAVTKVAQAIVAEMAIKGRAVFKNEKPVPYPNEAEALAAVTARWSEVRSRLRERTALAGRVCNRMMKDNKASVLGLVQKHHEEAFVGWRALVGSVFGSSVADLERTTAPVKTGEAKAKKSFAERVAKAAENETAEAIAEAIMELNRLYAALTAATAATAATAEEDEAETAEAA